MNSKASEVVFQIDSNNPLSDWEVTLGVGLVDELGVGVDVGG